MKRYFGLILSLAFGIALVVYGSRKWNDKAAETARDASWAKLKLDAAERLPWLRFNPDEKGYKEEAVSFFRWYFKEYNEHLNRFGGSRDYDEYLKELDERAAKAGAGKAANTDDRRAAYDYVRKIFDEFKGGNYSPMWTGTDKGVRIDLLSTRSVISGGETKTRYQLVVWGLPKNERVDEKGARKTVADGRFSVHWKMTDEKGKLHSEMDAPGDPSMRVDWPERYIKAFPPGFVLGHYDVDQMPAEAKSVEITFSIMANSHTGGQIAPNMTWKLDVPAEWKIAAGSTWKGATESVRPEDEINPPKPSKK